MREAHSAPLTIEASPWRAKNALSQRAAAASASASSASSVRSGSWWARAKSLTPALRLSCRPSSQVECPQPRRSVHSASVKVAS